ncbi:MAG: 4-Hydroxy-2-oxoglutarate aldolase [Dehalococcoidia bacterium]|nr:4-Hydroxy-2-oxoglutarate aldolase [Dehalococcoidia bacterium]
MLVAVVRTATPEQAIEVCRALVRGGITLLEITMTIPQAATVIAEVVKDSRTIVGAGSVTSVAQADAVLSAGARFVVSPVKALDLIPICHKAGVPCIISGLTPTEILEAHEAGSDMVKVFPASSLGGPAYIRALREPLPQLKLMPSGGVGLDNLKAYLEAGASALALGGSLMPSGPIERGEYEEVAERARQHVAALDEVRRAMAAGG